MTTEEIQAVARAIAWVADDVAEDPTDVAWETVRYLTRKIGDVMEEHRPLDTQAYWDQRWWLELCHVLTPVYPPLPPLNKGDLT
jgi:hypothetical protein